MKTATLSRPGRCMDRGPSSTERWRPGPGVLLVFLSCAAGLPDAPASPPDSPLMIYRQPISIEVARDSTPETAQATTRIAIHPGIASLFQNEAILLDPVEPPAGSKLLCGVTGESLPLGTDKKSPLYLQWTGQRLTKDTPAQLTVRVSNPGSLKPGVYRGTVEAILRNHSEAVNRSLRVAWDIRVLVRGRRLVKVEFERSKQGKTLRVGAPANLILSVYAVGCDLGQGSVAVDWSPSAGKPQRVLELSAPRERPADPLTVSADGSRFTCHPQWRESLFWTQVHRADVAAEHPVAVDPLEHSYEVRVAIPPCFLPGTMQAKVQWAQAAEAASDEILQQTTPEQPVLPGILVYPAPAFVHEPVNIEVRTLKDLGDTVPLVVSGPESSVLVELVKLRHASLGPGLNQYLGRFRAGAMGSYHVGSREGAAEVREELEEPVALDVSLGAETGLERGVEVFAGTPPFWRISDSGWRTAATKACRFWYDPRRLQRAEIENLGTWRVGAEGQLLPWSEATDPIIALRRREDDRLPDNATSSDVPAGNPRWEIAANPEKSPFLDLSIDLVRDAGPDDPRHAIGSHRFVQRMILQALDTRGGLVARIVRVPFTVQVSTAARSYLTSGTVVGLWVLVLLAVAVVRWRIGRRKHRAPRPPIDAITVFETPPSPGDVFSFSSDLHPEAAGANKLPPLRPVTTDTLSSGEDRDDDIF